MLNTNRTNNIKMVDSTLVNKILEQGQKLRNAMVGSILKNDPFNTDIIYSKHFNTPKTSTSDLIDGKIMNFLSPSNEKIVEAYLKGEYMSRDEETLALDTLRSMSAPDLCKTTERSLNSACLSSCKCYTCEIYNSNNLYCDLRRHSETAANSKSYSVSEITRDIQEKYQNEHKNLLKYVDSLKVSINSLMLNETGNRKVFENEKKVPYKFSDTYFLEYHIPDRIANKLVVSKSKVDSGLENNQVGFCSRRNNDTIHFKQVTIHDVKNVDKCNLNSCEIIFKISYRTQNQKVAFTLGFAKFNLGYFLLSKSLMCTRKLPVFLNENSPFVVGDLKVSLLLGCGRLYFGQEFIDAINSIQSESVGLDSDDSTSQLNRERNELNILEKQYSSGHFEEELLSPKKKKSIATTQQEQETQATSKAIKKPLNQISKSKESKQNTETINIRTDENSLVISHKISRGDQTTYNLTENKEINPQIKESEKQILFGFLYISEVQYLSPPINTYITCRPFGQSETSISKSVTDSSNPVFNFSQLVPLIYEDALLQTLRENYMVIEFWKKIDSTTIVFGLTKVPLHQFYLAYRNPVFVKYLSKNKLPIIDTDWWEPIYSTDSEDIVGQVHILSALGTEEQINNLKFERGFANNIVKVKFSQANATSKYESKLAQRLNSHNSYSFHKSKQEGSKRDFLQRVHKKGIEQQDIFNNNSNKVEEIRNQDASLKVQENQRVGGEFTDKAVNTSPSLKVQTKIDVGIQSSLEKRKMNNDEDKNETNTTQEMLGNFLSQLMVQRQRNTFVENSTNTEAVPTDRSQYSQSLQNAQNNTNVELRKTTDLLDSLQRALSLDSVLSCKSVETKPGNVIVKAPDQVT